MGNAQSTKLLKPWFGASLGWAVAWYGLSKALPPVLAKRFPLISYVPVAQQVMTLRWILAMLHAMGVASIASGALTVRAVMDAIAATAKHKEAAAMTSTTSERGEEETKADAAPDGDSADSSSGTVPVCSWMMTATMGYFINDLWMGRADLLADIPMLAHHVLGMLLMTGGRVAIDAKHDSAIGVFFLSEFTNTCLGVSWFLRSFNLTFLPAYKQSLVGFAVAFTIFRVIIMTGHVYRLAKNEPELMTKLGKVGRTSLYGVLGLQWFWWVKILLKMKRELGAE